MFGAVGSLTCCWGRSDDMILPRLSSGRPVCCESGIGLRSPGLVAEEKKRGRPDGRGKSTH
jgi:hypothetical protein